MTVVVIPVVTYFSWVFAGSHTESQSGWTSFGIIVALLGILTAWSVAFGTKESESALRSKAQKNGGPLQAFKALFQNDQLLWVALSYLLYAIANVATTGVLIFLFKFVLDNQAAYSVTGIIALVAGLVMAPLYPILNKRIPRRYLYIGGMISMIVAYVLLVFMFKVKISEKMHDEIVEQLEAKLASGEISDEEAETVETVEAVNEKAKTLTE
ncbi:MAG: MFS transporter [Olegusella sp.]|nr:MFS transporter [Olegusella sp.]